MKNKLLFLLAIAPIYLQASDIYQIDITKQEANEIFQNPEEAFYHIIFSKCHESVKQNNTRTTPKINMDLECIDLTLQRIYNDKSITTQAYEFWQETGKRKNLTPLPQSQLNKRLYMAFQSFKYEIEHS